MVLDLEPAGPIDVRPLPAGSRLGRYQIMRRLAVGGMAELYLARADDSPQAVAIKRVHPHLAQDGDFSSMFVQEARIAATLDHPNIVRVLELGSDPHEQFYAMEYLHGEDVRSVLREAVHRGGIPMECAMAIVAGAALGLHHAHESAGVVHRDVAPSNVIVTFSGEVKVVDFGIAKTMAQTRQTRAGVLKGKIGYMSPEACRGEPVDRRADVFGLGVLLYETTTGQRLFYAENQFAVMNNIVTGSFDPPSEVAPGYPAELEAIVLRSLAVERKDRYATAHDLAAALQQFATQAGIRLTTAPLAQFMHGLFGLREYPQLPDIVTVTPSAEPTARRVSRLTVAAIAAIPIALGLGVALGGGLGRDDAEPSQPPPPTAAAAPTRAAQDAPPPQAEPEPVDEPAVIEVVDDAEPPGDAPARPRTKRKRKKRAKPRKAEDDRGRLFPDAYYEGK